MAADLRYPQDRPYWLGVGQPWPCGRCLRDQDASEPHLCEEPPATYCHMCGEQVRVTMDALSKRQRFECSGCGRDTFAVLGAQIGRP